MIRNVKADSLASVFTDSTLSAFTPGAISKGVTDDSIIYIVCDSSDAATYGSLYTEGSHWIWAKGKIFCCDEQVISEPISTIDETTLLPTFATLTDITNLLNLINEIYNMAAVAMVM